MHRKMGFVVLIPLDDLGIIWIPSNRFPPALLRGCAVSYTILR